MVEQVPPQLIFKLFRQEVDYQRLIEGDATVDLDHYFLYRIKHASVLQHLGHSVELD